MVNAGSSYFNKKDKQDAFLLFASYCPGPRIPKIQKYFNDGLINQNGNVSSKYRKTIFQQNMNFSELSRFEEDPNELIIKLYELRNRGLIPKSCHHLKILTLNRKIFDGNEIDLK